MRSIRLGAGLGFYGDSWTPIRASLARGDVQYVGSDHLAELTLAILAKDRERDPAAGYTRDLVPMLLELYPLKPGVRWLLNAGGLNPLGAQEALVAAFKNKGIRARVAAVTGDALGGRLDDLMAAGITLDHLETGASIAGVCDRLLFANAYLGARPLVQALEQGADVVISGRVADAALFLAPIVHEFGWAWDDWNRLAAGIVVGHLLECSGQASGGNFGGAWRSIPDLAHIGYPIAEVREDGTAIVTKPAGTGGRVSFDTLREQLLYEVHDPSAYLTPDVIVDLTPVMLEDLGEDRVLVKGATGRRRPEALKLVAGYEDGWLAQATVGYAWPDALDKARTAAGIIRTQLAERGLLPDDPGDLAIEYLGHDSLHGPLADPRHAAELNEVYLRVAMRTGDRAVADRFGRLFPPLGLSGPPFVGGYGGITPPRGLIGFWPTLVPRERVEAEVAIKMLDS